MYWLKTGVSAHHEDGLHVNRACNEGKPFFVQMIDHLMRIVVYVHIPRERDGSETGAGPKTWVTIQQALVSSTKISIATNMIFF